MSPSHLVFSAEIYVDRTVGTQQPRELRTAFGEVLRQDGSGASTNVNRSQPGVRLEKAGGVMHIENLTNGDEHSSGRISIVFIAHDVADAEAKLDEACTKVTGFHGRTSVKAL